MHADFWHQRWANNEIGFHEGEANALLVRHFNALSLSPGSRIFVPLCGKTRDIAWFLRKGYRVVGVELSTLAVNQLFSELGATPTVSTVDGMNCYRSAGIDVFVGNIFSLTATTLGPVDAIYDRAALVALPEAMRDQYTRHLISLSDHAPQLVITFEYDQQRMEGPPFSISSAELHRHYQAEYLIKPLESLSVPGGLKGQCVAQEAIWLLMKH